MKEWALVVFLCQTGNFSNCIEDISQAPQQFDTINECAVRMRTEEKSGVTRVSLCKHQGNEEDTDYETNGHA